MKDSQHFDELVSQRVKGNVQHSTFSVDQSQEVRVRSSEGQAGGQTEIHSGWGQRSLGVEQVLVCVFLCLVVMFSWLEKSQQYLNFYSYFSDQIKLKKEKKCFFCGFSFKLTVTANCIRLEGGIWLAEIYWWRQKGPDEEKKGPSLSRHWVVYNEHLEIKMNIPLWFSTV